MLPAAARAPRASPYLPRYNARTNTFNYRPPPTHSEVALRMNPMVMRRTLAEAARQDMPAHGSLADKLKWFGARQDVVGALKTFEDAAKEKQKLSVEDWGLFLKVCDPLFPSKIRFYNYGMKKFLEEEKNPQKVLDFKSIMDAAGDKPDELTKELVERARKQLGAPEPDTLKAAAAAASAAAASATAEPKKH